MIEYDGEDTGVGVLFASKAAVQGYHCTLSKARLFLDFHFVVALFYYSWDVAFAS